MFVIKIQQISAVATVGRMTVSTGELSLSYAQPTADS